MGTVAGKEMKGRGNRRVAGRKIECILSNVRHTASPFDFPVMKPLFRSSVLYRWALSFSAVLLLVFFAAPLPVAIAQDGQASPFAGKTLDTLTADDILKLVRYSYTMFNQEFEGRLRQGFKKTPFILSLKPNHVRFKFTAPLQIIHLSVTGDKAFLKEVVAGSDAPIADSRYSEKIRNTDVTFEDLAMRFLYWKNPKIFKASDEVKGRDCWWVRVTNPDGVGSYATVDIWVDKISGGLMQMIGYNALGEAIKRFTVVGGKKINDVWMVDEMRIETLDPARSGKSLSKTYLEILDAVE
jgi:hypothetical protein